MIKDMKDNDIKVVGISNSKSKDKTNWKVMGAIIGIVVLALGVIAGIILVRQNQNISEKAKECNLGGYACPDSNNSSLLRDCSTGEEFPNDSLCNSAGRVEVCGSTASNAKQFCCPSAGAAWTTNLTLCSVAATPTPTATATATATASPTATNTSKATAHQPQKLLHINICFKNYDTYFDKFSTSHCNYGPNTCNWCILANNCWWRIWSNYGSNIP